jgi:hypothetical protein
MYENKNRMTKHFYVIFQIPQIFMVLQGYSIIILKRAEMGPNEK